MRAPRFIHQHKFDLAADALLISSGLFALATSIGLTLLWVSGHLPVTEDSPIDDSTTSVFAALLSLFMLLVGLIIGPALAWTNHGHVLRWRLIVAPFAAAFVVSMIVIVLSFLASGIQYLLTPVAAEEFTGAVVVLVVVALLFVGVLWHAVRDAMAPAGDPPQLERLRLLSLSGLVVLVFVVAGATALGYAGGIAEALIFAMLMGFIAAAATMAASAIEGLGVLQPKA
jgi:hypothetical protein